MTTWREYTMDQQFLSLQRVAAKRGGGNVTYTETYSAAMLTAQQWTTLQLLVDVIIPPDDVPGGWDAGVGEYLVQQFQGALQLVLDLYRQGLDALDCEAQSTAGNRFAMLDNGRQIALLKRIEMHNVVTTWPVDPAAFFALVIEHAMEGYYSDPANGGNRDAVAWHMLGFEVRG